MRHGINSFACFPDRSWLTHFRALGMAPGDTVMVHASVRAVGEIAGGPDQIHLAIKDALTDRGTMMMYASCPEYYDDVGRGVYPGSVEREILEKMPAFDAATARAARDNGTLVEFFRSYPGYARQQSRRALCGVGRATPAT